MTRLKPRDAKSSTTAHLATAADIPLAQPNTNRPVGKTLYEIATERQAQLAPHGQPFPKAADSAKQTKYVAISPDGKIIDTSSSSRAAEDLEEPEPVNPMFDTLFLALPLSFLHFTLSFLTVHQYAQELKVWPIIINTIFVAFPTLFLVIHLLHGHLFGLPAGSLPANIRRIAEFAQQTLFVLAANVAGCYLIYLTNDKGYYAVMKKAPSIGTIWVWSVMELGLAGALAGVAGPGLYAWWNGYGII